MDLKALSLATSPRPERLSKINELLLKYDLRALPDLGDNSTGQPEIIDIVQWSSTPSAPFHDIAFLVRRADGKEYTHTVRFNAHGRQSDGVVFIPEINGRIALVRQYRIAVGMTTWELARGFSERNDFQQTTSPFSLPSSLIRELGEEVISDAHITSVQPLGLMAENTGTHNSWIDAYVVRISADPSILSTTLGGKQQLEVKFVTWAELFDPGKLQIRDLHSLAIIALVCSQKP